MRKFLLAVAFFPGVIGAAAAATPMSAVHPDLRRELAAGRPQAVIVRIEDASIQAWAAQSVVRAGASRESPAILREKAARIDRARRAALAGTSGPDLVLLREYRQLPFALVRLTSPRALERLAGRPGVVAIIPDRPKYPVLDAYSTGLIGESVAGAIGDLGAGVAVAVIDTGVNYTLPDFGSCTAPGVPGNCRVVYYANLADASTVLDANGHGTNVSGIVAGVAPASKVAMLNVFGAGSSATDSTIIQAIDWAISSQSLYGIGAINMSLGDGNRYTAPCISLVSGGTSYPNPYQSAVSAARSAGILTVAAAGNNAYSDGISAPACTPGVVSVGAVYSASWGGPYNWGPCTDPTTAADQVTCFSNSAPWLSLLAPGAFITAAGSQYAGTSQASPFVAGAAAVLRSAWPGDSVDMTVARLVATGAPVLDARNATTFPRLSLAQAVRPFPDLFANRTRLTAVSGSTSAANANATKEAGEPNHAGNPGGKSIWWSWVAPVSGPVVLDTHGSGFDTLLAVYTGPAVGSLTQVAANDNDGSAGGASGLVFQAIAGTEYAIAIDGAGGVSGPALLNWSLNVGPAAALTLTLGSDTPWVSPGRNVTFSALVRNAGPAAAASVILSDPIPAGLRFVSASPGCVDQSGTVVCSLGTIAALGQASVQIVLAATGTGIVANPMTLAAATPQGSLAGDSATITELGTPGQLDDAPTLPQWGSITLAAALAVLLARSRAASPGAGRHGPCT